MTLLIAAGALRCQAGVTSFRSLSSAVFDVPQPTHVRESGVAHSS